MGPKNIAKWKEVLTPESVSTLVCAGVDPYNEPIFSVLLKGHCILIFPVGQHNNNFEIRLSEIGKVEKRKSTESSHENPTSNYSVTQRHGLLILLRSLKLSAMLHLRI